MNWIKRKICQWVREDWENVRRGGEVRNYSPEVVGSDDSGTLNSDPVLNFRVYSAIGGRVVEFRRYDRGRGQNDTTTYIITEDQNFGERIAKIATMENLKA